MLRYIDSVVDSNDDERLTVDGRDLYQEIQRQDEADLKETLNTPMPSTKDVQYPEDSMPASDFNGGQGVDPTYLPMMRQEYMQSPEGGIAELPGKLGAEVAQTAGLVDGLQGLANRVGLGAAGVLTDNPTLYDLGSKVVNAATGADENSPFALGKQRIAANLLSKSCIARFTCVSAPFNSVS